MSHNALVFDGGHLEAAHYAAVDPRTDVVLVPNFMCPTGSYGKDRREVVQRVNESLSPLVRKWWEQRDCMEGAGDTLRFFDSATPSPSREPHIDMIPVVGYVVTVNVGDTPRSLYASRQGVPNVATDQGINKAERRMFREELEKGFIPPVEDWLTLNPGDAGFFGALPNLAVHATEGETLDVVLAAWSPIKYWFH